MKRYSFIIATLLDRILDELTGELTSLTYEALKNQSPSYDSGETTVARATIFFVRSLARFFPDQTTFTRAICKGSTHHEEVVKSYLPK